MAIWVHSLTVLLCLCIQKEFPWNLIHFPRRRQFPTDGVANPLINGHLVARLQAARNGCRVELVFPLGQQFDNDSISFSMDPVDQLKTKPTEGQRMLVWEFPSTRIKAINRIRVCRSKYVGIELSCQSVIPAKLRLIPDEE